MSKPLTLFQIKSSLNLLSDDQLWMTATIYDAEEGKCFPIFQLATMGNMPKKNREELEGVVEQEQPLFVIKDT